MMAGWLGADRLVGDRYALEALIGRGGMGEVWRARHVALDTLVAIKLLLGAAEPSEHAKRRFLTEARVTATLKTRYAVQVFDFGVTDDGLPYLVMELLEGDTLSKRIAREGRLCPAVTSRFLQKAARALEKAHALGIVHRDFKPENVMLVDDEEDGGEMVKVVDFGIAKLVGDLDCTLKAALGAIARRPGASSPPPRSLTSGGVGTPQYMAPEQVRNLPEVGPAADIWAFGIVAYECLTGRRPYEASSVGELMRRVLADVPPTPASSLAPVPTAFDDWFRVACARDPRERFADVQTAALALAAALDAVAVPIAVGDAEPRAAASDGGEAKGAAGGPPEAPPENPPLEAALDVAPTLASAADAGPGPAPRASWPEADSLPPGNVSPLASTFETPPHLSAPFRSDDEEMSSSVPVSHRQRAARGERSAGDDAPPRFGIARTAMGALAAAALALTLAIHDAPHPVAGIAPRVAAARVHAAPATHPASASLSLPEPTALGGAPVAVAPVHPQVDSYPERSEQAELSSELPPAAPSIGEGDSPLASLPPPETDVGSSPQQSFAPPSPSSGAAVAPPRPNTRARASTARSSAFALGPLGL